MTAREPKRPLGERPAEAEPDSGADGLADPVGPAQPVDIDRVETDKAESTRRGDADRRDRPKR